MLLSFGSQLAAVLIILAEVVRNIGCFAILLLDATARHGLHNAPRRVKWF